jgi:ATP-dependent helicase/nuclease subunit A
MSATPPGLPRELVLASAGTGKTFRISSRIIGLLAARARPEDVFASTFTRKAAGEILDRVLARLARAALDAREAGELAAHVALDGLPPPPSEPDFWLDQLSSLLRELHRFNVGTLDSFFVRTAATFAEEAGLPPAWTIDDGPPVAALRSLALGDLLGDADRGLIVELVRGAAGGDAGRSVHDAVLRDLERLLEIHLALDPSAADAWNGLASILPPVPPDLAARQARIAARIRATPVPITKKGTPRKHWQNGLEKAAAAMDSGAWVELSTLGLCQRAWERGEFDRESVPADLCDALDEARDLARAVLGARLARRGRTLGRLAARFADALARRQRESGVYGFSDLTRLLGGEDPLCGREDLHYRLDARIRHLLLDEFQDTSLAQWEALSPLAEELLSGHADERAAVIVADPKQSIYAWRGGEPLLVRHVGDRFALHRDTLSRSYRSSQVVLDFVNHLFADLADNGVFAGDERGAVVVRDWVADFERHEAARALPGHVRMLAGPRDEGRGEARPRLRRRAAALVAGLRDAHPGRSIGVLTRSNAAVARIMFELKRLEVPASEEGGNPLTDSAPVAAVLALLRLADHPGDRISRYFVAHTPLGAAVGYTDHEDADGARRLAARVRMQLVEDGYGRTLAGFAERIRGRCDAREARRLDQLVELAFRYEPRATLRPTDFVRRVESERVEAPTEAEVRVMTIHQSKGLEFDIVVLAELDAGLTRDRGGPLAYRPEPTTRITRVFPPVPAAQRALFEDVPELVAAADQAHAAGLRDALSGVYVAVTRARHALHLLVCADGENGIGTSCSAANLLRHAVGATGPVSDGDVLFESGNDRWSDALPPVAAAPGPAADAAPVGIALARPTGRRSLPRHTPSGIAAAGGVATMRGVLRLHAPAAEEGTLVHAWMEQIEWLDDGPPDADRLRAVARRIAPHLDPRRVEELILDLGHWLAAPAIRAALSRASYPDGAEVRREVPFVVAEADGLLEGFIDRLVLVPPTGGAPARAEVLDFKTDRVEPGDREALAVRAAGYRPQLDAYRRGVHAAYGVPPERVAARLLFLYVGAVLEA